jgi:hypothetical protein
MPLFESSLATHGIQQLIRSMLSFPVRTAFPVRRLDGPFEFTQTSISLHLEIVHSYICEGVSFQAAQTTANFMMGLTRNSSKLTNSYTEIDFAWYCTTQGALIVSERGAFVNIGTYKVRLPKVVRNHSEYGQCLPYCIITTSYLAAVIIIICPSLTRPNLTSA